MRCANPHSQSRQKSLRPAPLTRVPMRLSPSNLQPVAPYRHRNAHPDAPYFPGTLIFSSKTHNMQPVAPTLLNPLRPGPLSAAQPPTAVPSHLFLLAGDFCGGAFGAVGEAGLAEV